MQLRDAGNILRNGYDKTYVEDWAEKMGVANLLAEYLKMLDNN